MPINLEIPRKFEGLVGQANQVATEVFRRNSRKYDLAEHEYPRELDMLAALIDGMNEGRRARRRRRGHRRLGLQRQAILAVRRRTATAAIWPACSG